MIYSSHNRALHVPTLVCGGLAVMMAWCLPAFCALGGNADSVASDAARLKAVIRVTRADQYSIQELSTSTGIVVREYISPSGKVFGIAWNGPFVPEMKVLLGGYFEHYSQLAKAQRESRVGRHPLNIEDPLFVMQTSGHMGAYSGRAYDPQLLPQGLRGDQIQ
jgi:hypothetical protein